MLIEHAPIHKVLRLMVLYSLTQGGFKKEHYESVCDELLKSYGYDKLFVLHTLALTGLCAPTPRYNQSPFKEFNYGRCKQQFHLVVESDEHVVRQADAAPSLRQHTDISYVFSYAGYAPLSVRLLGGLLSDGTWDQADRVLPPSHYPSFTYRFPASFYTTSQANITEPPAAPAANGALSESVLIFFVGGVTYAEISAIRFLSRILNMKLLVASTHIVTGNSLLDTLITKVDKSCTL
eukprot:TRINITY_DN12154_c0_g1_i1.p1 TRINITY_DN12154_c0_g1~~TRINITY_DN12154_c0_g1_i1.p1  ORF type:complete len:236 (-),score=33.38 TRINITY_DN12154_c0_g1_i1:6-713(-)